jgi:ATP-dependent DNA ligase
MENLNDDNKIMHKWYSFAADQPNSVDALLRLLRERQGISVEEQQQEFGASTEEFTRLRGMKAPRPNLFKNDAQRIAEACKLSAPFKFINALVLARNLQSQLPNVKMSASTHYQAAFDHSEDLDNIPEDS